MRIDLDQLLKKHPALYATLVRNTGRKSGVHEIDIEGFTVEGQHKLRTCAAPDFNQRLREFNEYQQKAPVKEFEPLPPQRDLEADLKADLDRAAGLARIEQYAAEQGLERTLENAAAIKQWLDENVKGYVSAVGVDLAIQWLGPRSKNVLTWAPKTVAPPPKPEAPTEVLATLKDGSTQLPLEMTPSKHHTTAQLKDWLARTNAGKLRRPSGGFGSSF